MTTITLIDRNASSAEASRIRQLILVAGESIETFPTCYEITTTGANRAYELLLELDSDGFEFETVRVKG